MMYRTTPHSTTGVSPAELLFRRKRRTRLPGIDDYSNLAEDQDIRDRNSEQKEKGNMYIDQKRGAKESDIKTGDSVLLKQKHENKLTPTFSTEPYRVMEKIGNSVTVESPSGVQYRRNTTHIKKLLGNDNSEADNISYSENTDDVVDVDTENQNEVDKETIVQTRPNRVHKMPEKFKDILIS